MGEGLTNQRALPGNAVPALAAIEITMGRTVNYAMQQNDVPVLNRLRVVNTSETPFADVTVRITVEPEFATTWEARVAAVGAGQSYDLGTIDLVLSHDFLAGLPERVAGALHVAVLQGERPLARRDERIDVLAYDEWGGLSGLPEVLAAFVMPNHPVVEGILSRAADLVRGWTGDAALSAYQSKDQNRVAATAAAIYTVLQKEGLRYISPPASFEETGQKIRLPDRIFEHRLATCLDLAVLTAACLEQAGLYPLVIFTPSHASVGVWLVDECFADSASDDLLRVRKRAELGEICVFETTLMTADAPVPFAQAVAEGNRRLAEAAPPCCVVDIQRARKSRIRPLPLRTGQAGHAKEDGGKEPARAGPPTATLPELPALAVPTVAPETETPATRLDRWKRKLLDLTLHNRLLNFRETKKTLPILAPDLASLEDALAEGERFRVHPRPRDLDDSQPRDVGVHRARTGEDALAALLQEEFTAHRLRASVPEGDLSRRLLEIFRDARTSLEESGANILYLALGFLAWYETPTSPQRRLAPIILIPLEVERHSVQEGFSISRGDDEAIVNTTLLELLRADFGLDVPGMDPIPQDEHGTDVPGILTGFRQAVKTIDRWEVVESACIGLFSFTKFLMWRDLQVRSEDLSRNKVVAHLIHNPHQPFPSQGEFPDPAQLDDTHPPEGAFCPLSADSSQLAAVHAAAEGRSFVLHGPPGTGKSQTITNLIAHSLASGKSVLFVSEKMAALSVVQRRLEQCGLGPFCLEIHSNKSRKQEVLRQLERALDQVGPRSSEDWLREAARLASLRQDLNAYVRALHRPRETGETVFHGITRLMELREVPPVAVGWEASTDVDRDELERLRDLTQRLEFAGRECGHPATNAWAPAGCDSFSQSWRASVEAALSQLQESAPAMSQAAQELAPALTAGEGWSEEQLRLMGEVAKALLASPVPPAALVTTADWDVVNAAVVDWVAHGRQRDRLRAELCQRYTDQVLQLDLEALRRRLQKAESSWALPRWLGRRAVRSALARVAQQGPRPDLARLDHDLGKALALRQEEQHLAACGEQARSMLGSLWAEGEANWDEVERARAWSASVRRLAAAFAGTDLERAAGLREQWTKVARQGREQLQPEGAIGRICASYLQCLADFSAREQALASLLSLDEQLAWGGPDAPEFLGHLVSRLTEWRSQLPALRPWCFWRAARREALEHRLQGLISAYEGGQLQPAQLVKSFERGFYQWWVEREIDAEPALRDFFSREFERKIRQFQEVDERYLRLTRAEIQARLSARVPQGGQTLSQNSELGILRRQIQRKTGHMPVRALFQRIPNLLPRIKPCLLMSPISVAQYLDPAHPPFDLVVFDEASQMPVWDAVGAIARGQEVVVVGDPMQLPPTDFFNRADEQAEADDSVVEDLESILDDCLAAQLPSRYLEWHYRSRHESLIAFSNHHYYGNRLLTFPSPHQLPAVSCRHVDGVYDLARSRTNRAEAEAVVEEIVHRLRDPELSQLSLGVVTFSLVQQTLVEDLLEEARRKYPEIEPFFSPETAPQAEPVFVKNLENVQGDERDVILFSVCYGPDAAGKVSMNFGPLNREAGHRRLNVAITRARQEVTVFSTLRPEQIDLARTRARGMADLKAFLEYAERGPAVLKERRTASADAEYESPFEQQVAEALRARGHEVHLQVGCSDYRIDLAIVDPEAPGRYLLGIECDGANYHRARTARDRDRLRESILQGLGWRLHRIWSTDWWERPQEELDRIEAALEEARRQPQSQPTAGRQRFASAAPAPAAPRSRPAAPSRHSPRASALQTYTPYRAPRATRLLEDFHSTAAARRMRAQIEAVVAHEGPVSFDLLCQRVVEGWDIQRVTQRVRERIEAVLATTNVRVSERDGRRFLWAPAQNPEEFRIYRVPDRASESRRNAEDLPPEEVANAALAVLEAQVGLPVSDLLRETARLFGFSRLTQQAEQYLRPGVALLLERGVAVQQNEMVVHHQQ